MRITLPGIATRLALVGAPLAGAYAATRDVGARHVDATTAAACASHLPGNGARCDSDQVLTAAGPFILPGLEGAAAGLLLVVAVLFAVGFLVSVARSGHRHAPPATPTTPAWVVPRDGSPGGHRLPPS